MQVWITSWKGLLGQMFVIARGNGLAIITLHQLDGGRMKIDQTRQFIQHALGAGARIESRANSTGDFAQTVGDLAAALLFGVKPGIGDGYRGLVGNCAEQVTVVFGIHQWPHIALHGNNANGLFVKDHGYAQPALSFLSDEFNLEMFCNPFGHVLADKHRLAGAGDILGQSITRFTCSPFYALTRLSST